MWRQVTAGEMTRVESEFLAKALNVPESGHVLDVPCGNGRLSIELARRGIHVTGVDQSEEFISEARASGGNLPATWIVNDMRKLAWREEFDGAFCFGNSFGYLNARESLEFIKSIARALKLGSRFVLDSGMAAESILPNRQKTRWFRLGDIYMLSENEYDAREGRLDIQYTFIRDGKVDVRPSSSYVLTVREICAMHEDAGLEPVEVLGSITGEPYQLGSPRLILVSRKR
jgi:SAM-dependent methyltransferase